MANPRKFSEKIALLNQKQAEGNAQFEQVMKEVSDATKRVNPLPKQHLRITQALGSFRGGSLPNVNHVANSTVECKTDQPIALSNLEELKKSGRSDAPVTYRERGRSSVGVGPMRSRPAEKRIDTSPYSGAYLSPPPDSAWRRTNSDSALHQSAMCGETTPRRQHHDPSQQDPRPRSCYDGSLVPGINIYPSQHEPGALQIPISNNTGSLPDLTCFHFPSPLPTPLDQEDHGSSPLATSPHSVRGTRFYYGGFRPHDMRVPNPRFQPHSPAQQRRRFYPQQNIVFGPNSPSQPSPLHVPCEDGLYSHLTVPSLITSSYLHHSKVVTQEQPVTDGFRFLSSPLNSPRANCSLSPLSPQTDVPSQPSANAYRSPQPARPSPQSSPSLAVSYRSTSPGESHNSAPPSPISPAGSPANHHFSDTGYYLNQAQAQALQQHFEQFNMMDPPSSASITYITSPNSSTTQVMSPEDTGAAELATDPGYYSTSPSQLQFGKPCSTQQTTPQTPNTPSSIPDIILTDFSSAPDDLSKHDLVKDLGQTMTASFDSDLFASDESLREGLGPIDFDGFQMLTDPDMVISDPTAEDHFRLDRL